jgi:pimeloyl-ACP methyl ester carboxylesterase
MSEQTIRLTDADPAAPEAGELALRLQAGKDGYDGPCVLYLHGFGSSQDGQKASYFRQCFGALGLPFCSFDFQGHGESAGELGAVTLSRNLSDIRRARTWLQEQDLGPLIMVGSSMGAAAALWSVALQPERVVAGLYIAPALDMLSGLRALAGAEGLERWRRQGSRPFTTDLVDCRLGWGLMEDLEAYPVERLIDLYRVPTLLLQGKNDASVDWHSVLDFAVGCPYEGIEMHFFADGDHRLLAQAPHLWRMMVSFLLARGWVDADLCQALDSASLWISS